MPLSYTTLAGASKTRKVVTLTTGTSWTVPAGVTYVNATLIGGGQGGAGGDNNGAAAWGVNGIGGQIITTTVSTTPGASITYAIGAGGAGGAGGLVGSAGSAGGNTTFTGATTALGGSGTTAGLNAGNGGAAGNQTGSGATGGAGQIILEYWT